MAKETLNLSKGQKFRNLLLKSFLSGPLIHSFATLGKNACMNRMWVWPVGHQGHLNLYSTVYQYYQSIK